jgi:predicted SprT family Zn-dependent metalloprotease
MNVEKAMLIAEMKMLEHNLCYWSFELGHAKNQAGSCNYRKRIIRMSRPIIELNDEHQFMLTLLHEIAHALVGSGNGHNYIWKKKCIEIGGDGKRCFDTKQKQIPKEKWKLVCNTCDNEWKRHRRSRKTFACTDCCNRYNNGEYSAEFMLEYKLNK